ncbi:mitochondrial chaperone bcs1, putative [Cordyceps militaris CM01]|uniref:Mitochondrial chaperone bcs1, putative n=1 Tax=Cordyceps militaris (strain CM01) TaxID=983644 RepID=G3JFK6_CORMM|nr:mitochondrial chaperone bcs1, putative [Cordyceps militaris CM01]EGX93580.1 mitochondrial chaperone bcs1, putative [Cordyceps militaris CM01]
MLPLLPTDILPAWVRGHYETWLYLIGIAVLLKPVAYLALRILAQQYIYIRKSDEAYDMLLGWIFATGVDKGARSVIARVGVRGLIGEESSADPASPANKKRITLSPWNGALLFWFRGRPVYYTTQLRQVGLQQEEEATLVSLGRSGAPLRRFLDECRQRHLRQAEQRRWYAQRGIPYRRGYLFYGRPGTGKTSLSLSVAGHFELDIYRIQISGITDDSLKQLFEKLPGRCVVLLEDVDAIAKNRAVGAAHAAGDASSAAGTTMSGLLNIIDGVSSQEGRILIMTTNYAARLDAALVRPGRIDVRVEFPLADRNVARDLFDLVYRSPVGPDEETSGGEEKLPVLADAFAARLPERLVSPAEVMSFLLQHQDAPQRAVDCVQEWIDSRAKNELRE